MKHAKLVCPHCGIEFTPDPANEHHQVYCAQTDACRKASHRVSSERNRAKTQLTDPEKYREQQQEAKKRVRLWRLAHPKYWLRHVKREKRPENIAPIRDILCAEISPIRDILMVLSTVVEHLVDLTVCDT